MPGSQNYRSTQPILAAANAVINLAEERFTKNLWSDRASAERPQLMAVRDEADQARYVVEKVLGNREAGLVLKAQAILFRASHHSGPLEVELTRRNIPFVKFGGLKFLEAAHVKDVLAFLRWAENPHDRVAGFRVIQLLPGVGPVTAAKALDRVAELADPMQGLGERRSTGPHSSTSFGSSAPKPRAGPPNLNSSAGGTSRTSSASTTTRACGSYHRRTSPICAPQTAAVSQSRP